MKVFKASLELNLIFKETLEKIRKYEEPMKAFGHQSLLDYVSINKKDVIEKIKARLFKVDTCYDETLFKGLTLKDVDEKEFLELCHEAATYYVLVRYEENSLAFGRQNITDYCITRILKELDLDWLF